MAAGSRGRRLAVALLPSGITRLARRRRLVRRHGLARVGPDFDYWIADNNHFEEHCGLGGPVYISGSTIGAWTYVEVGSRISQADIGRFCSIAPYSVVGMAEHPTTGFVSTHPAFYRHAPGNGWDLVDRDLHQELQRTRVGNDVWIGVGACVRGGLTIGDGAIVGAGAVVTRDVEPYEVVGGVPARTIRYRFDETTRQALLESRWWEHDADWLRQHAHDLRDVDAFLERHREAATGPEPGR